MGTRWAQVLSQREMLLGTIAAEISIKIAGGQIKKGPDQ
jgi:hypothetical protein